MIRYSDNQLKPEIIRMWKAVFNDSDEFINLYFRSKYKDENTLVKVNEGQVASSLQMLPYTLTFCDSELPVAYISGASTFPEERKKGYMEELLVASFSEMKKKNVPITILIPQENWLFGFYEKYGYAPVFEHGEESVEFQCIRVPVSDFVREVMPENLSRIADYCRHVSVKQPLTVQKTHSDWLTVFEDHYLANGKIFYVEENQEIKGVAFVLKNEENEVLVKELLTDDEVIRNQLLNQIAQVYGGCKLLVITSLSGIRAKAFGMARIIDAQKILTIYAQKYPRLNFSIHIVDNQCDWNTTFFRVNAGQCVETESQSVDFDVTINLFTQLMFGYRISSLPEKYHLFPEVVPKMSLMLE